MKKLIVVFALAGMASLTSLMIPSTQAQAEGPNGVLDRLYNSQAGYCPTPGLNCIRPGQPCHLDPTCVDPN